MTTRPRVPAATLRQASTASSRRTLRAMTRGRKLPSSKPGARDRWRFHRDGAPLEVQVGGTLASTSGEVIHDWALGGHGIAFKAEWDIVDDLRESRLVECLAAFSADEIHLHGVFAAHVRQPLRLRVMIDFMRGQFPAIRAPGHRG